MVMVSSFEAPSGANIHCPLIPMVVALIIGIECGTLLPGYFALISAMAVMFVLGVSFLFLIRSRSIWMALALCACAGYLSIQPWMRSDLPDGHVIHFADQGYWQIEGMVANTPRVEHDRWQFVLRTQRLADKQQIHEVFGRIKVSGRGAWPQPKVGDTVRFRGRLRSIRSFANPGGFDYQRYMKLKGIRVSAFSTAKSLKIISVHQGAEWRRQPDRVRERIAHRMDASLRNHHSNTLRLLKAVIIGDRHQITAGLRESFNRAGVGHILAISGLHVGMVAAFSFAVAGWLLATIPAAVRSAWVRKGAALASLGPVLGYSILSGMSSSTQRAMIMVTVVLLGLWVGRRHNWLNTLALAAMAILVTCPPALFSVSFQLSFAAVLAILAGNTVRRGGGPDAQDGKMKKMLCRLLGFMRVSAMAILGTLPVALHYFNQVSLVGLITNLVVVPMVGVVVLPAGLLGALGSTFSSELATLSWQISAWGMEAIRWIVQYTASWSWAAVQLVTPSGLEIGLYYLLAAVVLFWQRLPHRSIVLAVTLGLCMVDLTYWGYQRFGRSDLRVTVLDVGQSSANLLELPGGYIALVDGGGFSDNKIFDMGARVVAPLLWHKKIKTVDLVVLTHANSDHLNGLLYILKHFNVSEVWSNQEPAPTRAYRQWIGLLASEKIDRLNFSQMPREVFRHGVRIQILSPVADFMQRPSKKPGRDSNNNSLVLRVSYGDVSFLFAGDIMHGAENELVSRIGNAGLKSTILVVPHHGSSSSSSMPFIEAVMPQEALISAGWQNRFKLPHPVVLNHLESVGSRIWCTADAGAVEITTTGTAYCIAAVRRCIP